MILPWLTIAIVVAVALVLAGYLIAILAALAGARKNVARLADGLEAIAGHTEPLEGRVGTIADALGMLRQTFAAIDDDLDDAAAAFQP